MSYGRAGCGATESMKLRCIQYHVSVCIYSFLAILQIYSSPVVFYPIAEKTVLHHTLPSTSTAHDTTRTQASTQARNSSRNTTDCRARQPPLPFPSPNSTPYVKLSFDNYLIFPGVRLKSGLLGNRRDDAHKDRVALASGECARQILHLTEGIAGRRKGELCETYQRQG